ncbi:hypothetical protein M2103_001802 [Ereboglobus sp. PH5-5]|nr:hypothetical protein [Ereboglobus sp. PH5-10]MDF9833575.1 hypothetical protein [Ereboglobus sp. PH5-5]
MLRVVACKLKAQKGVLFKTLKFYACRASDSSVSFAVSQVAQMVELVDTQVSEACA